MSTMTTTALDKIWAKVQRRIVVNEETGCEEIKSSARRHYPQVRYGGRYTGFYMQVTHLVWLIKTGKLPVHNMCHTCDNHECVKFEHLYDGTQAENMQDMIRKGRARRGTYTQDWWKDWSPSC